MSDSCILRVSPQQQEQTGNSLGFFVAIISTPSTFTQISSSSDPISKTGELCGLHTRGVHTVVICLLIGFIYAFFHTFHQYIPEVLGSIYHLPYEFYQKMK